LFTNSLLSFSGDSSTLFIGNNAYYGGAVCTEEYSNLLVEKTKVQFENNSAISGGGAIYSDGFCNISFYKNALVTFNRNNAEIGGAIEFNTLNTNYYNKIFFMYNSTKAVSGISFNENSVVMFDSNEAESGGAIECERYCNILFNGDSMVTFTSNNAKFVGGAIHCHDHCNISVSGNSLMQFNDNSASTKGGAMYFEQHSSAIFMKYSNISFNNNLAEFGGAVFSEIFCGNLFDENTSVIFENNTAIVSGGALFSQDKCKISFDGNSLVLFNNNSGINGGAVHSERHSNVIFDGNTSVRFFNNSGRNGGALYSDHHCNISFSGGSSVTFYGNNAVTGGAVYCRNHCYGVIQGESNTKFLHNSAIDGGALYSSDLTDITIKGNAIVLLYANIARGNGGAIYTTSTTNVTLSGNSEISILNNVARQDGGALYCSVHSSIKLQGNVLVTFTNNTAEYGGAISAVQSSLTFTNYSVVSYGNNTALSNGGALCLTHGFTATFDNPSSVSFHHNTANGFGGAIYSEVIENKITFNNNNIDFVNNAAFIGSSIYIDIPTSCGDVCLNKTVVGISKETFQHSPLGKHIDTPPSKLVLGEPATCTEDDNDTKCEVYYIRNIMLGQEIMIDVCVLDFFDQTAIATQFVVSGEDQHHKIEELKFVSLSCETLQGVSIIGSKVSNVKNFSMTLTSHISSRSAISVKLTTELSPCHPGFYYDDNTQRCICYNNDIVSCSGDTSSIKRGYWFGEVNGKTTVSICPNNYCNFSCCEITDGFYQLSPVRINQCSSQRSGIACGSCEKDYTLSFDSVKCVKVTTCTNGQTALVASLSMLYWLVVITSGFVLTHYQIGIGYLYVITYYYSVLDILLGQTLYLSQGLFTTVSIVSSIAKVTPQFLGQLCLVQNMSGIDQKFIHYVHPLAITIFVAVICQLAKISYKFSSFVSRGIIHVVCFLLLLSYTSVATTSLMLLRSLRFQDVNKVYTYLSPDIEYFHGRHLAYVMVAVLCTLVIVISLPLLLLLEPFINHKINFSRIKPLLDQFQGCYKDKYRCFAAYYMIYRLIIISILITNPSSDNTTQVLLTTANIISASVQLTLKPYSSKILNIFDGIVLQLMSLVPTIPLMDRFNDNLLLTLSFVLVALPLMAFGIVELLIYRESIKKITTCFKAKPVTSNETNEVPMNEVVIDDNMRKNATIVDM